MSRTLRVRLALVTLGLLLAAAIFGSAQLQGSLADRRAADLGVLDYMTTEVADGDAALATQRRGAQPDVIAQLLMTRDAIGDALERAAASADTPAARDGLERLEVVTARWLRLAGDLVVVGPSEREPSSSAAVQRDGKLVHDTARELRRVMQRDGVDDQHRLTMTMVACALLLVLGLGGAGAFVWGRREREHEVLLGRETRLRVGQDAFADAMQLVSDEDEAHMLLKRHVERELDGADAVVLNRNNSDNRLDATTPPPVDLEQILRDGVEPRACLAVRSGRGHARTAGDAALIECGLCGKRGRDTTCQPLLVSGEVIGAVLVGHGTTLDALERRTISDAVAQAAPVLGNLRTLAIAETRAATDALTGLPNRRALQDTLKRMVATAQRGGHVLGALAIDLDHFKQINDVFGHEKGDEVLAAVGRVLAENMRASDFAARAGGEEFVALLPETDTDGSYVLAEKLREAISRIEVPGVPRTITASFGVAAYPTHAFDAPTLLRKSDRALYAAKEGGRDRTEVAALPVAEDAAT